MSELFSITVTSTIYSLRHLKGHYWMGLTTFNENPSDAMVRRMSYAEASKHCERLQRALPELTLVVTQAFSDASEVEAAFFACEARELHDFLDEAGVPRKHHGPWGKLSDGDGAYSILPLIDRVQRYAAGMTKAGGAK